MPLYLVAAMMQKSTAEILELEPEVSIVHHYLCRLHDIHLADRESTREVILLALQMYEKNGNLSRLELTKWFGEFSCVTRFEPDIVIGKLEDVEALMEMQEKERGQRDTDIFIPHDIRGEMRISRWLIEQTVSAAISMILISIFVSLYNFS